MNSDVLFGLSLLMSFTAFGWLYSSWISSNQSNAAVEKIADAV